MSIVLKVNDQELQTTFDGAINHAEMDEINLKLSPFRAFVAHLYLRYTVPKLKKLMMSESPLDDSGRDLLMQHYVLPLDAMTGLCTTAGCVGMTADELSGTYRSCIAEMANKFLCVPEGGHAQTQGDLGKFPALFDVTATTKISVGQPFQKLHTNAANDGTGVNEFMTLLSGSASFCQKTDDGSVSTLQVSCSDKAGWRILQVGTIPHSMTMGPSVKCIKQIIGPEKWHTAFADDNKS